MTPKRFVFPLQKLLRLREFEEERARIALGRAVSEVERLNAALRENAGKRAAAGASRAAGTDPAALERNVDMDNLRYIERYVARLDSDREKLLEDLTAAELVAEQKRNVYIEASKNVKIIQKVKDKKREAWYNEYLESQAEEIDDIINSH